VLGLVKSVGKSRVELVKWTRRMLAFAQDWAAINTMEERVKLVRLVRKTPVINENVGTAFTLGGLAGRSDWSRSRR
jgi:hypothetical protein